MIKGGITRTTFSAAGMTMMPEQLGPFINKFEEVVSNTIPPDLLIPEVVIDAEIKFTDIKVSLYNIISQMEPFGPENFRPIFVARNLRDSGYSKIVKEDHLRVSLVQDQIIFTGIGFNLANKFSLLQDKRLVDLVFTLDENEWNGSKHLQLKVIDLKPSA